MRKALRHGRAVKHQRVLTRSMELRTLNALQRLVQAGLQARSGQPLTRSEELAVEAIRDARPARVGAEFGTRVADVFDDGRGLTVRVQQGSGTVFLQELERAGTGFRPVTAHSFVVQRGQVAPLARAFALLSGLRVVDGHQPPPFCVAVDRGINCHTGAVDPEMRQRAIEADYAALAAAVNACADAAYAPPPQPSAAT